MATARPNMALMSLSLIASGHSARMSAVRPDGVAREGCRDLGQYYRRVLEGPRSVAHLSLPCCDEEMWRGGNEEATEAVSSDLDRFTRL